MSCVSDDIKVNDRVRSFDFPFGRELTGEKACFVEGRVIGNKTIDGCLRYVILVNREVWGGKEVAITRKTVYPPVNGIPQAFGSRVTDGVQKL